MKITGTPSLACGVIHNGEIIFSEGCGLQDLTQGIKATDQTIYGVGSLSKGFAAAACGILVAEGKLDWGMRKCFLILRNIPL
jgi:CubicO group peptidase (beta-lactamase class C family)